MSIRRMYAAHCAALALTFTAFQAKAVDFSLFGDISLEGGDREEDTTTFRVGELDLLVNQDIDDRSYVNAEIIFEDTGHGIETDVERLSATYLVNDSLNLGAGRYHTPLGFWNFNFHHGMMVQDTVDRPFFLEFEDAHEGIFPTHIVGLVASGTVERKGTVFSYHLAIANSPSIDSAAIQEDEEIELDVNNYRDPSDEKTLLARIGFAPEQGNWAFGLSAMDNHIAEAGEPADVPELAPYLPESAILFEQQVVGVDARYTAEKFYVLAEYFRLRYTDNPELNAQRELTPNPDEYASEAYYAQFGYAVSDKFGLAVRVEELKFDAGATYYALLGIEEEKRTVYCLRYNLSESNVLRFQLTKGKEGGESFQTYVAQWFFMLF